MLPFQLVIPLRRRERLDEARNGGSARVRCLKFIPRLLAGMSERCSSVASKIGGLVDIVIPLVM